MPDNMTTVATIQFNTSGVDQTVEDIDQLPKVLDSASEQFNKVGAAAKESSGAVTASLKNATASAETLRNKLAEVRKEMHATADAAKAAPLVPASGMLYQPEGGLASGKDRLLAAVQNRADNPTERGRSPFANIDRPLSALASLNTAVGGPRGGSDILGVGAGVANVADKLPRLKEGLEGVAAGLIKNEGVIGKVASKGAEMAGVLGPTAAGFGAVAAVALPLVVILGSVTAGVLIYNKSLEESSASLDRARVSLDAYYEAIGTGTTETIQKQIDDLKKAKTARDAEIADIQNAQASGFKGAQQDFGGDAFARLKFAVAGLTNEDFKKLQARLEQLQGEGKDAEGVMDGLQRAIGSAGVAANDAAEKLKAQASGIQQNADIQLEAYSLLRTGTAAQVKDKLAQDRIEQQVVSNQIDALRGLHDTSDETKGQIAKLTERLSYLTQESGTLQASVLPLVEAREKEAEAAKKAKEQFDAANISLQAVGQQLQEMGKAHDKELSRQAEQDGIDAQRKIIEGAYANQINYARQQEKEAENNQKIIDLRTEEATAERKILADEGRIDLEQAKKQAEAIDTLNNKYMQTELKALKSYQEEVEKSDSKHKTERLHILQDMYEGLFKAASDNDVVAFLDQQAAGKKSLDRYNESASEEDRQRDQAFADQQEARHEQYIEQLQQINDAAAEELKTRHEADQRQIDDLRTTLDARIEAEKKSNEVRYSLADSLEARLALLRDRWRQEDIARQRKQEQDDYNERYTDLVNHQTKMLIAMGNAYQSQLDLIAKFGAGAVAILQATLGGASGGSTSTGAGVSQARGGIGGVYAMADGAVADRPMIGLLGEKPGWGDMVIPFNKAEGIQSGLDRVGGLRGGATINVDMRGAILSGAATQSDLEALEGRVYKGVGRGIREAGV